MNSVYSKKSRFEPEDSEEEAESDYGSELSEEEME